MSMSPSKKIHVKQAAILGLIVGVFLFIFFYLANPSLMYLVFVPLASAMGAAAEYVRKEPEDD